MPLAAARFILGFSVAYLLVTLAESLLHQHIHHARRGFLQLQARYPRLLRAFREAFRSHAIVHHVWTNRDHVTQFRSNEHKRQVDSVLSHDAAGRRIKDEEDYGVTLNFRSTILFVLPILPVVIPAAICVPWAVVAGGMIPVMVYPLISKLIHPYLHQPYASALKTAPWTIRWILKTSYMRCVWRHHWLHHRHPHYNFNLLLGGDWLRGVHLLPTDKDMEAMRRIGLPVN